VIPQGNVLVGVLCQCDQAGMQMVFLMDLSCANCCLQVKVVIIVVLIHELTVQTTHVFGLLLICAPEVASFSYYVADHVDFVDEWQPLLAFRLVLQVLVHLVRMIVLNALQNELIDLVIFDDGSQAESVQNFVYSARLSVPLNIIEA